MEHVSEGAPLASESRAGSEQVLLEPAGPTGTSNSHALKIAGITALVCLLLCAQAFTAYMVFDQRQQIQGLQTTNQRLQTQMSGRSRAAPVDMVMPAADMLLLDSDDKTPKPAMPKAEPKVARPSVESALQAFMKDFKLPQFNQSFLANLQTLRRQVNETSWKSFESWMRCWLMFQTAQKTPTQHPAPRTKCQVEASTGLRGGLVGSFKPQCDEKGNYKSVQCWASTRQCWCVDESGAPIKGTKTYGQPDCGKVLRSSRTSSDRVLMPVLSDDQPE